MTTAPELSPEERAKVAEFDAAPDAFRETSVDQLTARDLGLCVVIPDREVVGYLYAVHDDFNDGYPSRSLVLVSGDGQDAYEEEFTDSDPAGYPKTMTTPCKVENAPEPPEIVVVKAMLDLADNLDYYAGKTDGGTYAGGLGDAAAQIRSTLADAS